jgi:hypothetical protein
LYLQPGDDDWLELIREPRPQRRRIHPHSRQRAIVGPLSSTGRIPSRSSAATTSAVNVSTARLTIVAIRPADGSPAPTEALLLQARVLAVELLRLRSDAVEWRQVEDEVVALDLRSSTYLAANRSAAPLWQLLAAGTTEPELVARLTEACGIDRPRAERDVADFLRGLVEHDLLDRSQNG